VQEQAFEHIFKGRSVLVTVPIGTGKTLMAKAGLFKALAAGQTAVYTTPLRALTEEKYREQCEDFGPENVGFATSEELPEWRIIDEATWEAVQNLIAEKADESGQQRRTPLTPPPRISTCSAGSPSAQAASRQSGCRIQPAQEGESAPADSRTTGTAVLALARRFMCSRSTR
jgi:ATP-dependent helicase YprA (DUF1998 family)